MAELKSSTITSRPPEIQFTNRFVQPPSALYVFRDDRLFINSIGPEVNRDLRLRGRLLTPDGQVVTLEYRHVTNNNGNVAKFETFDLQEGHFIGLTVVPAAIVGGRGLIHITCGLTRGGNQVSSITQILFAGYIEGSRAPSWPMLHLESTVEGPGRLTRLASATPSAGAEIGLTVTDGTRSKPITMSFELTTDANAANRRVHMEIVDGTSIVGRMPADAVQVASDTRRYTACAGAFRKTGAGGASLITMPIDLVLGPNDTLRTVTTNLQAGDQFTNAQLYLETWPQG